MKYLTSFLITLLSTAVILGVVIAALILVTNSTALAVFSCLFVFGFLWACIHISMNPVRDNFDGRDHGW